MLKNTLSANLLFIVVFSLMALPLKAQIHPFEILSTDRNHLALESDIPTGFEPIFPDTTVHVLFNPARAISYGQNFTYASVFSNSSGDDENPDIRYVGLFGKSADKKWLVTFANDVRNSEQDQLDERVLEISSDEFDSFREQTTIQNTESRSSLLRHNENDNVLLSAGLNRILKKSNNDHSLGLHFIYKTNSDNRIKEEVEHEQSERFITSFFRGDTTRTEEMRAVDFNSSSNSNIDRDYLVIDLSHSVYSSDLEFINKIGYQYGSEDVLNQSDRDWFNSSNDRLIRSDTVVFIMSRSDRLEERRNFNSNHESHFFSYRGYFGKSLSIITPEDYFFIDLNGGLGFGDVTGRVENFLDRKSTVDNEITSKDTTNFDDTIDEDVNHYFVNAKVGFTVRKKWDKLYAYTGVSPSFRYQKSNTDLLLATPSNLEMENEFYDIRVNIPVLIQYRIKKWLDIYSFVNWGYRYTRFEEFNNETLGDIDSETDIGDFPSKLRSIEKIEDSDLDTFSNFTFAANIKHKSGIRAQIAFLGDFANFNRWNFSIGYHF